MSAPAETTPAPEVKPEETTSAPEATPAAEPAKVEEPAPVGFFFFHLVFFEPFVHPGFENSQEAAKEEVKAEVCSPQSNFQPMCSDSVI